MADIAAQSLALSDGYGKGYRPVGTPASPRFTVSKAIVNNGDGTARVTLTVTCKTNSGYIGGGYTITLYLMIGGVTTNLVWKASADNWVANGTYSKAIALKTWNVSGTTQTANLYTRCSSSTYFQFDSNLQGGTEITGLPVDSARMYVGNASKVPKLGEVYVGNASKVPVKAKEVWVGNASKVPKKAVGG